MSSSRSPSATRILMLALLGLTAVARPLGADVMVGDRADLSLTTFDGQPFELTSLRGSVVLIDFWATWCVPCRESFPFYAELRDRYRDRGFEVVAVSVDDDRGALDRFMNSDAPPFPVLLDASHQAVATFAPPTMPASYFVDRNGIVRYIHLGFDLGDRELIEAQVRALIAEPETDPGAPQPDDRDPL